MRDLSPSSRRILFYVTIPAAAVFVALLAVSYWFRVPNCKLSAPEQVDIVFDKTKHYSPTQEHSVDRTLVEILTAAADNAEINLFYITKDPDKPDLVANVCRPSTRGSFLFVDTREQQLDFRRLVIKTIKAKIDLPYQPRSPAPLVESLATITRQRIITAKLERGEHVEFYLYSDMVQDSKQASIGGTRGCRAAQLQNMPSFKDVYGDVKYFFRDVPVHVLAIHRDPAQWPAYPGERCVRAFWEDTFSNLTWTTF